MAEERTWLRLSSGGSRETGETSEAGPGGRARERGFCTRGPSPRVSERRQTLREWKMVCGSPLLRGGWGKRVGLERHAEAVPQRAGGERRRKGR